MPILNYTTKVDVSKTMGEIQGVLARRGVSRISTLFDDDGNAAGIAFTMKTEYGVREFELPVRTSSVLAAMQADPQVPKASKTTEQAARTALTAAHNARKEGQK